MNNDNYRIKLGKWIKNTPATSATFYQCSECGNIDEPDKKTCSNCKAQMLINMKRDV